MINNNLKSEVLSYLEEMIGSGVADRIEEKVYEDIKWNNRCKESEWNHVLNKMNEWEEM